MEARPARRGVVRAEERRHLHEVRVRLDAGATVAAQALLGEVDRTAALEGLVGMIEHCRLHLKAIDQ
jgi:hypothetical protein